MIYNKLVRDRIPEIIRAKGQSCTFHVASAEEYGQKLCQKLLEEVTEFQADQSIEEMADIFEVITAILEFKNYSLENVVSIQSAKRQERGSFKQRVILERVS